MSRVHWAAMAEARKIQVSQGWLLKIGAFSGNSTIFVDLRVSIATSPIKNWDLIFYCQILLIKSIIYMRSRVDLGVPITRNTENPIFSKMITRKMSIHRQIQ